MASREPDLTLQEAADLLGVHYMTAYRYVRTGRLPGTRVGAHWHVRHADLDKIAAAAPAGRNDGARVGRRRRTMLRRLTSLLVQGDEAEAWRLLQAALGSAYSPEDLYFDVLGPAMRRVGDDWAAGRLDVADEHRATVVMYRLVGRLGPLFARRGTARGAIVLGAPTGDPHGLATALVADPLRGPRLFDRRSRRQHARRLVGEHHHRHAAHRRSRHRRLDTCRRRTHRHNHRHDQGPSRRARRTRRPRDPGPGPCHRARRRHLDDVGARGSRPLRRHTVMRDTRPALRVRS